MRHAKPTFALLTALLAASCGGHRDSASKSAHADDMRIPAAITPLGRAQAGRDRIYANTFWQQVEDRGRPAMIARFPHGMVLVSLLPNVGYQVIRLDVNCAKGGVWSVLGTETSPNDAFAAKVRVKAPSPFDPQPTLARVCRSSPEAGQAMPLLGAVAKLRAGEAALGMGGPRKPNAADIAAGKAMYAAWKAKHPG